MRRRRTSLQSFDPVRIAIFVWGGPRSNDTEALVVRASWRVVRFSRAVEFYEKIEATTKRLEMTDHLVQLFKETPKREIDRLVYLTLGKVHPGYTGIELGLAEKLVIKVLAQATGLPDAKVTSLWKAKGDLGLVAEEAIEARRQRPLDTEPLTLSKVYENLDEIARAGGT